MGKRSFRHINDEVDEILEDGIDAPLTDEDGEWWNSDLVVKTQDEYHQKLAQRLDELDLERRHKMEAIALKLQQWNADIEDLTNQIRRLTQWRDATRNRHDWLKKYTAFEMLRAGMGKFVGRFTRMWVRTSPISAAYVTNSDDEPDVHNIDPRFVQTVVTHKVDSKEAISLHRKAIKHFEKTGEKIDGYEIQGFAFKVDNKHLVYDKPKKEKTDDSQIHVR